MPLFGAPNVDKLKAKGDVEGLIKMLGQKEAATRTAAAVALREMGDKRAVGPLVAALPDPDEGVREAVAQALLSFGPVILEPLLLLLKQPRLETRQVAAEMLGLLGKHAAVEPLLQTLKDYEWPVRESAAEALGAIRDVRAVRPLIEALQDGDRNVRVAAAAALGEIGYADASESLIKALKDVDPLVVEAAARGLVKIGAPACPALLQALWDWDLSVRQIAGEALAAITGQDFGTDAVRWRQWWDNPPGT